MAKSNCLRGKAADRKAVVLEDGLPSKVHLLGLYWKYSFATIHGHLVAGW
jgi:hypothetical protein